MARLAVVLCNLGGPDGPAAVRPFLFNLFSDPAILRLPWPLRRPLAALLARRRAPVARANYALIGGASPLLALTRAQASALRELLAAGDDVEVFVAMRYWRPDSEETARAVAAWRPDRVAVLPLYPQYSTTTAASSLRAWARAARRAGLAAPSAAICCYPAAAGLVAAHAAAIRPALREAAKAGEPRLLFSAHGLPRRVVEAGDPYQWQIERTASAVAAALAAEWPALDWCIGYQSRVGPLRWLEPSTGAEIRRAGAEGRPLAVAPIAFVSEHVETLVELDIEYRELAAAAGVPRYVRAAAPGTDRAFIGALAELARAAFAAPAGAVRSEPGGRICPAACGGCPLPTAG